MEEVDGTVLFCSYCGKYLCEECNSVIHSFKAFRDHKLERIDPSSDLFSAAAVTRAASPRPGGSSDKHVLELCPFHQNVCARLFCEDCKELCCYLCILSSGEHSKHRVMLFKDAYEKMMPDAASANAKLSGILAASEVGRDLLESEITGCQQEKVATDKEICAALDTVVKAVHERAAVLEKLVDTEGSTVNEEVKSLLARAQELRTELSSSIAKLITENGDWSKDALFVLKESGKIEKTAAELEALNAKLVEKIAEPSKDVVFINSTGIEGMDSAKHVEELTKKIESFGLVKTPPAASLKKDKINIKITKPPDDSAESTQTQPPTTTPAASTPSRKRNITLSWEDSVSQLFRNVVKHNEDAVYKLEMKVWNEPGKKAEEEAQYKTVYQSRDSEFTLSNFEDKYGRLRLSVGDKSGAYTLWKGKPQVIGNSENTYYGSLRPNTSIRFRDSEHFIFERAERGPKYVTAIGTETLEMGTTSVFFVRVVDTKEGDNGTSVGVAPADIATETNRENREECGWYLNFFQTRLYSGPPQKYRGREYARRGDIKPGDVIRVTFDATGDKGVLSFAINGNDFGVAYSDIPLVKPIVPAIFIYGTRECAELCSQDFELPEVWNNDN